MDKYIEIADWLDEAAQEVIDWGSYASEYFQSKWDLPGAVKAIRARANHVRNLAQASPSPWISIEERQPENPGDYLITAQSDDGPQVTIAMWNTELWEHDGEPTFCKSYYFEPTHWMPLPVPAASIPTQEPTA